MRGKEGWPARSFVIYAAAAGVGLAIAERRRDNGPQGCLRVPRDAVQPSAHNCVYWGASFEWPAHAGDSLDLLLLSDVLTMLCRIHQAVCNAGRVEPSGFGAVLSRPPG